MYNVYIGYDMRMPLAFCVAAKSVVTTSSTAINVNMLHLPLLQAVGNYTRPTLKKDGVMHDVISNAPMSTEFAISRFLVPMLCGYKGWAVFCDSDFLFMSDISEVFKQADETKAVMVVKHKYDGWEGYKMDGQKQTAYPRKNWSSFILFNCGHEANKYLTTETVNTDTGRALHGFHWLTDDLIGDLTEDWNWLEGHSSMNIAPKAVHFTRGTPDMPLYSRVPYAEEWWEYAKGFDL